MKDLLRKWYEETIIPAIILACLTGLVHFATQWFFECAQYPYISLWEVVFAFLTFLILMTIEDVWVFLKEMIDALSCIEDEFRHGFF